MIRNVLIAIFCALLFAPLFLPTAVNEVLFGLPAIVLGGALNLVGLVSWIVGAIGLGRSLWALVAVRPSPIFGWIALGFTVLVIAVAVHSFFTPPWRRADEIYPVVLYYNYWVVAAMFLEVELRALASHRLSVLGLFLAVTGIWFFMLGMYFAD